MTKSRNISYEGSFHEFIAEDYYISRCLKLDKKTGKVFKNGTIVGQHSGVKINSDSIEMTFTPLTSLSFIQVKVEV